MALGGNPIFNGKNFRGATQAPPVPQAQYGQNPYGQQYGQNPYAPWKTCVCNAGYEGGFQYPCTSPDAEAHVHSADTIFVPNTMEEHHVIV